MRKFVKVADAIINLILGENTPPAVDFVREIRQSPFAIR